MGPSLRLAMLCPPVAGHLNPMRALARTLRMRGHHPVLLTIEDTDEIVRADGTETAVLGRNRFKRGYVRHLVRGLGERSGVSGTMYWQAERAAAADVACREAPDVIRRMKADALLVDQIEPAGRAIAEHMGLPFVTVGTGFVLNREGGMPPVFTDWSATTNPLKGRFYDLVSLLGDVSVERANSHLRRWRAKWGLPQLPISEMFYAHSPLLQIMQMPETLDIPRRRKPEQLHYVGPLRDDGPIHNVPFPFEKVEQDGRPLVYASLGTLQIERRDLFRAIAEALWELNMQVVIFHGGSLTQEEERSLPGNPIVQASVPQEQILKRAALCVTHGGLNTVLDALGSAVPLVVMPIAFEQSAIAARVHYQGAGLVIPAKRRTAVTIRDAARTVCSEPRFKARARKIADDIKASGGTSRAAELIENALGKLV